MNELELLELLENLYKMSFLDSIKEIQEKELLYKKSDFFKSTKIPLTTLYEKFFIYTNSRYSFEEKLNEFIIKLDVDRLTDLAVDWIEKLEQNEKFSQILQKIIEKFDLKEIKEAQEDIANFVSDVK